MLHCFCKVKRGKIGTLGCEHQSDPALWPGECSYDLCTAHTYLHMLCVGSKLIFSAGILAAKIFHCSMCNNIQ